MIGHCLFVSDLIGGGSKLGFMISSLKSYTDHSLPSVHSYQSIKIVLLCLIFVNSYLVSPRFCPVPFVVLIVHYSSQFGYW